MIKKLAHLLLLVAAMAMVNSCAKKNTFTGKPVYKKNGGEKNETLFNKRKVKMEALLIESIKLNNELTKTVVQQQVALANSSKLSVIPHLESTVNSVLKELDELSAQLSQEVTYNNEGLEKIQEIRKQLIDLLAKKIGPTSKIIIENSRIRELKSDLAFETGKYKLKPAGIAEITNQVSEIEKRIIDWEQYLDNNGIKIFEKDSFDIKVTISGYADAQGPANVEIRKKENLDLSAKRAESVKNEFQAQLNKLIEKHKFKANVVFEGRGEELPPNMEDNGKKNNPSRRICLIVSVVSPSSLLVEK